MTQPSVANEQPTSSPQPNKSGESRQKALQEELRGLVDVVGPGPLVDLLLERAFQLKATDIHLDPQTGGYRVRFRIDGVMQDAALLTLQQGHRLVNQFKTMADIAWQAYHQPPAGLEPGLEAVHYYDPPNFTYPFGIYLCVVDIDRATGETKIRRFYALDDCGTRINPMIIEGQIHGGLTEGLAVAMGQQMPFDAQGNLLGNTLMDYFLPTAVETPKWETDFTVTPSPHHPLGAKGVAESPHVGGIPCLSNAVVDAFAHLGVTHMDMPHSAWRVWQQCHALGLDRHAP